MASKRPRNASSIAKTKKARLDFLREQYGIVLLSEAERRQHRAVGRALFREAFEIAAKRSKTGRRRAG